MSSRSDRPTRRRTGLLGFAAFAAGAALGVAAEELVYRRAFPRNDPEAGERFGSVRGKQLRVKSFDGTELAVEAFGPEDAPACVLLHGMGLASEVWHYQVRDLVRDGRFRVVVYDARGHGRSALAALPDGRVRFDAEALARDLFAVLHHLNARPAVLVGHSMGGMTLVGILEFAEEFPEEMGTHVRGLVLVNTTFTAQLGMWREAGPRFASARNVLAKAFDRFAADPRRVERLRMPINDLSMLLTRFGFGAEPSPAHVALTRRLLHRTPSVTLAAAMRGLADFENLDLLKRIDVPVLICAGDRDILTPAWIAREMADRIPGAELVVFPGTGHMAMLERYRELNALLKRFLDKVLG